MLPPVRSVLGDKDGVPLSSFQTLHDAEDCRNENGEERYTCRNRNMLAEIRTTTSTGTRALGFSMPNAIAAKQTYEHLYKFLRKLHNSITEPVTQCQRKC